MKHEELFYKPKGMCILVLVFALVSTALAWLFYDSIYAAAFLAPCFAPFRKTVMKYWKKRHDEKLTDEFMSFLQCLSTTLSAGLSAENAFKSACHDMGKLFGSDSGIVRELTVINSRVSMGRRLEDALFDMAKRTGLPEIYDFAVVFEVAKKKGADHVTVISTCVSIMEEKRQAEREARVIIRAKQFEQRVMCAILPGMILYLRLSSGNFIDVLYHNGIGITIMTVCLFIYFAAVVLAERIGGLA